ncbi:hemolysin family protein [Albibacterium profundi]|uniref:Hemolysin family protein n=1 Tax=Albibacterium profundi TaxID=3134906 RepID=A0ABV5CC07_9SPHI
MEILIILILIMLNGFFALSEIALVSVKKSRFEHLAAQGNSRAAMVLKLLKNPENFLSSVQVGITLIGIVSGAYGGAALTDDMVAFLSQFSWLGDSINTVAMIIVIGGITYVSIVIGELVPKTIAMNNAEPIALFAVPVIRYFTFIAYPFVKLLSFSTSLIIKLFGIKEKSGEQISEDELRFMLKTAHNQGVLENEETQVHQNLFMFTDQTAKSMLTHRSELEWINLEDSADDIFDQIKESVHSKFIVSDESIDNIKGVVYIKDFLENFRTEGFDILSILRKPIIISQNTPSFKILNTFKAEKQYIAIAVDEYGGVVGIVTIHDLFEAIVGDLPDEDEETSILRRADGTFLVDGKTSVLAINQFFAKELIEEDHSKYTTISGFILHKLRAIPTTGEKLEVEGLQIEIVDMDGMRIDKLLILENVEDESDD